MAPENPLAHKFGGSLMAAYRGTVRMCVTLRDLYRVHPVWVSRVWHFWSGVFSSCVRRGPLFPGDSDVLGLLTIVVFAGGVTDRVVRYRDQKPELLDCAERALGVALGVQAV